MKLIIFPLVFLLVFAILSQLGLGSMRSFGGGNLFGVAAGSVERGWWDSAGHKVCDENGTAAGEDGQLREGLTGGQQTLYGTNHGWFNNTNPTGGWVAGFYLDKWTSAFTPVYDTPDDKMSDTDTSFTVLTSLGLLGLMCMRLRMVMSLLVL